MDDFDIQAPFWEHVDDLRSTLVRCLIIIAVGVSITLFFYQDLFAFITSPLNQTSMWSPGASPIQQQAIKRQRLYNSGPDTVALPLPKGAILESLSLSPGSFQNTSLTYEIPPGGYLEFDKAAPIHELVIFGPIDGMTTTLKICFWVGFVCSSPLWLFFILKFIAPALRKEERRLVLPFLGLSFVFLTAGFLFAFYLTIPIANQYLQAFNSGIGQNLWGLSHYVDYTIVLLLGNGLAFELCVILLFLVHYGIVSAETMIAKRRHMIVAAFILGALLTPPDVPTQLMMAIPLILLYEATILYARITQTHAKLSRRQ